MSLLRRHRIHPWLLRTKDRGMPYMQNSQLIEQLLLLNCHHHCKIEEDGKCHNQLCMMCIDPEVKKMIKEEGCQNFTRYKTANTCPFDKCCLSGEQQEPGQPCQYAIIDDNGNPDCGYG